MSNSDYENLLQKSWDEIPEPQLLPTGSWRLAVRNVSFVPKKADDDKSKSKVLVFYTAKSPMEDVDDAALTALGDYDFANSDLAAQFFIERDKDWDAVRKHFQLLGVPMDGNIQDTFKKAKGAEVIGFVDERSYKNSQGKVVTVNTITDFAPAE